MKSDFDCTQQSECGHTCFFGLSHRDDHSTPNTAQKGQPTKGDTYQKQNWIIEESRNHVSLKI